MDINTLVTRVKHNCMVSDAQFWGYFSICGLLMRLIELYRDQHALAPWEDAPKEAMSAWIHSEETRWKDLEQEELTDIEIDGTSYGPFDIDPINAVLNRHGLIYGAGYAVFGKPTFFLARLLETQERYDYRIYHAGSELCRDLFTSPAMLQGRCVVVRHKPIKRLLWDKFQELRARRFGGILAEAFSFFSIYRTDTPSEKLYQKIEDISSALTELFILHELGEAFEDDYADEWLHMLGSNKDRLTEFCLRGIKDMLSDASVMGPLIYIARRKDRALLSFYMALFDSVRRDMFPEMMSSFQGFLESTQWEVIENARRSAYLKASQLRERMLTLWKSEQSEPLNDFFRHYLKNPHSLTL